MEDIQSLLQTSLEIHFPVIVDNVPLFNVQIYMDDQGKALLVFNNVSDMISQTLCQRGIAIAYETLMKKHTVHITYGQTNVALLQLALSFNGFTFSNGYYQKATDPFRFLVDASCFDKEGYLIKQSGLHAIPYGLFTSDKKGCGWIATYNFLKCNGKEKTMAEVSRVLGKQLLQEAFGENVFRIYFYLRQNGLTDIAMTIGKKSCIAAMQHSASGILLYSSRGGSHYTTYRKEKGQTKLHFYNAVMGKQQHYETPHNFFINYQKGFKSILIYRAE